VNSSLAQESDSRVENLRKYRSGVTLNEEDRLAILINEVKKKKIYIYIYI